MSVTSQKRGLPFDDQHEVSKRARGISEDYRPTLDSVNSGDDDSTTTTTPASIAAESILTSTDAISTQASTPTTPKNKPREKKFHCDFPGCGKSFARPVTLSDHQRSHTNERPFVCDRDGCDKSFLRDTHLKHHIKAHHDNVRDYICDWPDCGQAFATGQRLRAHRDRHDSREQCKCTGFPPCEQYFRKQETLQRHIAAVHLGDAPFVCDHQQDDSGDMCGRRFKQSFSLKQHKDRDHAGLRHACTLCSSPADEVDSREGMANVAFATFSELQNHIKTVHPPTCTMCGQTCGTAGQLKAHMDIEHQDLEARRTIPCKEPGCDKIFTKKGNMMIHYKSAHEQSRFVCGTFDLSKSTVAPGWDGSGACGEGFTTKASLEKHVRTQHLLLPLTQSKGKEKRIQRRARRQELVQEEEQEEEQGQEAVRMEVDPRLDDTVTRLTGSGYDTQRPIVCKEHDCPQRFKRSYDLELHLTGAHGYSLSRAFDAVEGLKEKEALAGGNFWIGGERGQEDARELEDLELASRLAKALN